MRLLQIPTKDHNKYPTASSLFLIFPFFRMTHMFRIVLFLELKKNIVQWLFDLLTVVRNSELWLIILIAEVLGVKGYFRSQIFFGSVRDECDALALLKIKDSITQPLKPHNKNNLLRSRFKTGTSLMSLSHGCVFIRFQSIAFSKRLFSANSFSKLHYVPILLVIS